MVPVLWNISGFLNDFLFLKDDWKHRNSYLGARAIVTDRLLDNGPIEVIDNILLSIFIALPSLALIILNSAMVAFAIQRSNTAINKRNLITVIIVTAMFSVSFIPDLAFTLSGKSPEGEYGEVAFSLTWLSCWTNPFIYLAVNPSFREFTKNRLFCRRSTVQQVQPGRVVIPPTNTVLANVAVTPVTEQVTAC